MTDLGVLAIAVYLVISWGVADFYLFSEPDMPARWTMALMWPVMLIVFMGLFALLVIGNTLDLISYIITASPKHKDSHGELWCGRTVFHGDVQVLRCQDSQGAHHIMVPPDLERARQAVAWTYEMEEHEYNPVRV
jgi:hypothetical protein